MSLGAGVYRSSLARSSGEGIGLESEHIGGPTGEKLGEEGTTAARSGFDPPCDVPQRRYPEAQVPQVSDHGQLRQVLERQEPRAIPDERRWRSRLPARERVGLAEDPVP